MQGAAFQTTTADAKTSTDESSPNATSETDPARNPATRAAIPSRRFQPIVAYSSRKARRRRSSASGGGGELVG
jgi:hypothetical protein